MRKPRTAARAALLATVTALTVTLAASPAGAGAGGSALPTVTATSESAGAVHDEAGGSSDADDPAIWRNPADPAAVVVVATAKEGGLRVYDLDARPVQSLPAPKPADNGTTPPGRYKQRRPRHRPAHPCGA
ncbi:phytase [Streptomyces stelliscabiei]|uniref:phytase n=1 Tax=Streptomyces stelliscabiei TaxID=146820 RepID=UPI003A9174FE